MESQKKLLYTTALLFCASGALLFFFDLKMLSATSDTPHLPYPLLSILVLVVVFIILVTRLNASLKELQAKTDHYKRELSEANDALEATTQDFEERVERRTFEISVANASLNREIAERIQAETETKHIKRQMELILESAGEGIFGLDAEGNVTFVNKAACIMLGWSAEEMIGKSHHDLVHHSYKDGEKYPVDLCPIHQAYKDGKVHYGSDEIFWTKEGKGFPVEYTSTPIMEKKKLTGAVVVFRDLSTFR